METAQIGPAGEDAAIRNQMERMVGSYDSYMRVMTLGTERKLRQATIKLARIKPGDHVLEVGCGTGSLTLAAKQQVGPTGKVCGIDVIPGMIDASRRKAARAGQDVTFQLGSIDDIPFPDGAFDSVLCSFMIFHMSAETRRKGLKEIRRVLKPGGQLFVLDVAMPDRPLQRPVAKLLLGDMLQHELQELVPVMAEAGFVETEVGHADYRILFLSVLGFVRGRTS